MFRPRFIKHGDGGGLLLDKPLHAFEVGPIGDELGFEPLNVRASLFNARLSSRYLSDGHLHSCLGPLEFSRKTALPGDRLLTLLIHLRDNQCAERLALHHLVTNVNVDIPEVPRDFRHDVGLVIRMNGGRLRCRPNQVFAHRPYELDPG